MKKLFLLVPLISLMGFVNCSKPKPPLPKIELPIKIITSVNDLLIYEESFVYDDYDNCTEYTYIDTDEKRNNLKYTYDYDKQGNILVEYETGNIGKSIVNDKYTCTYDNLNRLTSITYYHSNDIEVEPVLSNKFEYTYESNYLDFKEEKCYEYIDNEFKLYEHTLQTFDNKGRVITSTCYNNEEGYYSKTTNQYDDYDCCIYYEIYYLREESEDVKLTICSTTYYQNHPYKPLHVEIKSDPNVITDYTYDNKDRMKSWVRDDDWDNHESAEYFYQDEIK